jgi:hypothetical protein
MKTGQPFGFRGKAVGRAYLPDTGGSSGEGAFSTAQRRASMPDLLANNSFKPTPLRGAAYSAVSNSGNQDPTIVIARSEATWQSRRPHGLPRRFAPRNDALWSCLRIWHLHVRQITD